MHADDSGFKYLDGFPKLGGPNDEVHGYNLNFGQGKVIPTQLFSNFAVLRSPDVPSVLMK